MQAYQQAAQIGARQALPQWMAQPAQAMPWAPPWLQQVAEFGGRMITDAATRAALAYQRPEQRRWMTTPEAGLVPGAAPQLREPLDREAWRELWDPLYAQKRLAEQRASLGMWGRLPVIGELPALATTYGPAAAKAWEATTAQVPFARQLEQLGAVGVSMLQDPAIQLEQAAGAVAIYGRPESQGLQVADWYALTPRTYSLAYQQGRAYLGGTGEDVMGKALRDIESGRATAEEIAAARENLGAEFVGQMLADPLNLFDWVIAARALARAQDLTQAQARMVDAIQANPRLRDGIETLAAGLARTSDEEVEAIRLAAGRKNITAPDSFWNRLRQTWSPFELTPAAKADRDAVETWLALSGPTSQARTGEEAAVILEAWKDSPEVLTPYFGGLPTSYAGQKATLILNDAWEAIKNLPSLKAEEFNVTEFMVQLDDVITPRLRVAYGYKEPGPILRFVNSYKALMSEFYLTAIYSPGYAFGRNMTSDLFTMGTDGLATFERTEDIEKFFNRLGGVPGRRVTTEGRGVRFELTGMVEGESRLPGVFGAISKKGQEWTRHAEAFGRLPLGEEPRYRRALYMATKRFFDENALKYTPLLDDATQAALGARADDLRAAVARAMSPEEKRAAINRILKAKAPAQGLEPSKYLTPELADAMSPELYGDLVKRLQGLPPDATPDDLNRVFDEVQELVDADEARRLKDLEEVPTISVTTTADEQGLADDLITEIEEAIRKIEDPDLQARMVEDLDRLKEEIPKVEAELDRARGQLIDELKAAEVKGEDGLEILLAANQDTARMRDDTRALLNRLRIEARDAYQAEPLKGSEIWPPYFTESAKGWNDLAGQRVGRLDGARDHLRRLGEGESIEDILGMSRQDRAELILRKASKVDIPEAPPKYLPGRLLDASENKKFEAYLLARRRTEDAAALNAWRAGYGADPEDFAHVVDALDSAAQDAERWGKATAGRVREELNKALEQGDKAYRRTYNTVKGDRKAKQAAAKLAKDAVWERYYAIRHDLWTKLHESTINRWRIAERDILVQNWKGGIRMEPPTRGPKPPGGPQPTHAIQPGDADLVKSAALKDEAQWTSQEREAIERWTSVGQPMPEVQQPILPAAAAPPTMDPWEIRGALHAPGPTQFKDAILVDGSRVRLNPLAPFDPKINKELMAADGSLVDINVIRAIVNEGEPSPIARAVPPRPPYTREQFRADLEAKLKLPPEQAEGVFRITEARAKTWAAWTGKDPSEWYKLRLAGIEGVEGLPPEVLFQTDPFHGAQARYQAASDELMEFLEGVDNPGVVLEDIIGNRYYTDEVKRALGPGPALIDEWTPRKISIWTAAEELRHSWADRLRWGATPPEMRALRMPEPLRDAEMFRLEELRRDLREQFANWEEYTELRDRAGALEYPMRADQPRVPRRTLEDERRFRELQLRPSLTPKETAEFIRLQELERYMRQARKGAIQFLEDGRAVIHAMEQSDVSTAVHELGHIFRRELDAEDLQIFTGYARREADRLNALAQQGKLEEPLARHLFIDEAGNRVDLFKPVDGKGELTRAGEELFSRSFERYLAEGSAPEPALKDLFERFKDWLVEIYRAIKGSEIDVNLSDNMRGIFDRLLVEAPPARPGDVVGQERLWRQQARLGEARRTAAGAMKPIGIDDAAEVYGTGDDWDALADVLHKEHRKAAELADPIHLDELARQWAHRGEERWVEVGGVSKKSTRSATPKAEREYRRSLMGEFRHDPKEFYKRKRDLAQWYHDLWQDAQRKAQGLPVEVRTPPEWLVRERIEALEQLQQLEQKAPLLQTGRAEPPEWFNAKERYRELFGLPPEQIKFFDELTPAQVEEVRRQFTAGLVDVDNYVYGVKRDGGLVPRRERRRPMWEPKTPRPEAAPPTPPPARPAPPEFGARKAAPPQMGMFSPGGEQELPIFTGTPVRAEEPYFAPPEAASQARLPGMELEIGDKAKYAAKPAGEVAEEVPEGLEALRPAEKKIPKGQQTLWQTGGEHPYIQQLRQMLGTQVQPTNGFLLPDGTYAPTFGHNDIAYQISGDPSVVSFARTTGAIRFNSIGDWFSVTLAGGRPITDAQRRALAKLPKQTTRSFQVAFFPEAGTRGVEYFTINNPVDLNAVFRRLDQQADTFYQTAEATEETPAFRRWFGDSQVVDENGRPKQMYHGTRAPYFREFDIEKAGQYELFGPGFYFTDDPEVASGYAGTEFKRRLKVHGEELQREMEAALRPLIDRRLNNQAQLDQMGRQYADMLDAAWGAEPQGLGPLHDQVHDFYMRQVLPLELERERMVYVPFYHYEDVRYMDDTEAALLAEKYEPHGADFSRILEESGPGMYKVYLRIENPLMGEVRHGPEVWEPMIAALDPHKQAPARAALEQNMTRAANQWYFGVPSGYVKGEDLMQTIALYARDQRQFVEAVAAAGFDGVNHVGGIRSGGGERVHDVWIAFYPNQIKSAWNDVPTLGNDILNQTGINPTLWELYQDAAREANATHGPSAADGVQAGTRATRQGLDQMRAGMLGDWDAWRPQLVDDATRRNVMKWYNEQVVPQWFETRATALDYGRAQADRALLDYSKRRNLDVWLSYMFPYHYWFTRSGWNWAKRLAGRPGMLTGYLRTRDAMKLANENAGRRQRFETKIRIPFPWLPEWMGGGLYVDPLRSVLPFANLYGTNWDDGDDAKRGLQALFSAAQQAGFRPYHFWELPYQAGWFRKGAEALGMAPEQAQKYFGPQYEGGMPMVLPQLQALRGVTAGLREAGVTAIPPGGVNIEAPFRRALGLPAGEVFDPYRVNRMLSSLAAERPQDLQLARTALMAQELIARDETQAGKVWDPSSPIAQQTAQELNWTPQDLAAAQELLAEAMQRAGLEGLVRSVGWAMGPAMAIEPAGEKRQLELQREARGETWAPEQPLGSREAYQAFKDRYPAVYPRITQYGVLPGAEEGGAMPPGARANWLAARQEKEQVHADIDRQVDDTLRAQPWNWDARNQLEEQRREALTAIDQRYPLPEMKEGELPPILYGMSPAEMWDSVTERDLRKMQAKKPSPDTFQTEDGEVNWGAYYDAVAEWTGKLSPRFSFGKVKGGKYQGMDAATALKTYEQRFDSPLEAAYKTYQETVAGPAWDAYEKAKAQDEARWPGLEAMEDKYFALDKADRRIYIKAHPELKEFWDWKDATPSAYERTVGKIQEMNAGNLIPAILREYQGQEWDAEDLQAELEGVTFPALSDWKALKEAAAGGKVTTKATAAKTTAKAPAGGQYWWQNLSPEKYAELEEKVKKEGWRSVYGVPYWELRKKGGGGGGGGGGRRTYTPSPQPSAGRWRPPRFIRGGPFQF